MAAALCGKLSFEAELIEGSAGGGCLYDNVAALAAVTAVRSSFGDILFAPETDAPAPPVAGLDGDGRFIDEFHSA
jgi:hypothetical protein